MPDTRYADCVACGERYHGADIESYMVEVHDPVRDEWNWVCRHHDHD